jgi:hypothetical protein
MHFTIPPINVLVCTVFLSVIFGFARLWSWFCSINAKTIVENCYISKVVLGLFIFFGKVALFICLHNTLYRRLVRSLNFLVLINCSFSWKKYNLMNLLNQHFVEISEPSINLTTSSVYSMFDTLGNLSLITWNDLFYYCMYSHIGSLTMLCECDQPKTRKKRRMVAINYW